MAQPKTSKFHIAMFPWFAYGHMTPFLHLSNKLAERGHKISFLLPQKAQTQLENSNLHPNLITFHPLAVPHVEGLPRGAQTASDVPIFMTGLIATAMDRTRDQVEALLDVLKPEIVVFDAAHWIPVLATKIGFKTVCYKVVCAASLAIALVPARNVPNDHRLLTAAELAVPPPDYPSSTVVLHGHEAGALSFISLEFGSGITFYERVTTAMKQCDAISIRTCQEIEGHFCNYIGSQYKKRVFLTGPVLPDPQKIPLEPRWANWLGGFELGSVVFCAFGTQWVLEKAQFQELVLGLELTGLPFLVALKPPTGTSSLEEALPEGFEERVRGRGVVSEWVNQPSILAHPSIGCFVNHCGFGSMWESLMSDAQIVLLPHLGDQILNTRLLADELKVAVEVERDENGWFSKENLCMAIKTVMDTDGEMGGRSSIKKNHEKWKETLVSQGMMSGYIDEFIENLHKL